MRCERASYFLSAACSTANFLEKSSILNDLCALDIADGVEGLDEAKWNLEVVQKRLRCFHSDGAMARKSLIQHGAREFD